MAESPRSFRCSGTQPRFAAPLQRDATPLWACHRYWCCVSMAGCQARLTNRFAPERITSFESSATREAFLASTTPSDPLRPLKSPTEPTITNATSDAIAADDDILNGKREAASSQTSKNPLQQRNTSTITVSVHTGLLQSHSKMCHGSHAHVLCWNAGPITSAYAKNRGK